MTLDLGRAEYEELRREYFHAAARRGWKTVETASRLPRLLRHHRTGAISDQDTWRRDEIEYLLHYYAALEVASLSGDVRLSDVTRQDRARAVRVLNQPSVRRYYREYYPVLLPRLLRPRLAERWTAVADEPEAPLLAQEPYRISRCTSFWP